MGKRQGIANTDKDPKQLSQLQRAGLAALALLVISLHRFGEAASAQKAHGVKGIPLAIVLNQLINRHNARMFQSSRDSGFFEEPPKQ